MERSKVFHFNDAALLRISKTDDKRFQPSESVFIFFWLPQEATWPRNMESDKSAASPRPTYFGSTLEISRRRGTTSSRVSCLTNLQMIGFGPFVAFRP